MPGLPSRPRADYGGRAPLIASGRPAIPILILLLAGALPVRATVWHVPQDPGAATIAEALASAQPFDSILIAPGVYLEHDLVLPPDITISGDTDDPAAVVIDAQGQGRVMAVLDPAAGSVQIGYLTLTGGRADRGGALYTVGANVGLAHVRLVRNEAAYGGAVFAEGPGTGLYACLVAGNRSDTFGGGVYVLGANHELYLDTCAIIGNVAHAGAGAWYAARGARLSMGYCTVADNDGGEVGQEGGAFGEVTVWQTGNVSANPSHVGLPLPGDGGDRDRQGSCDWQLLIDDRSEPEFECCVREEGWPGNLADQEGVQGNVTGDPLFCHLGNAVDEPERYYGVAAASPCLPENSPELCGLVIGAYGQACDEPVGVVADRAPRACLLREPAPNPFNPMTTLRFTTRTAGPVRVEIYDLAGRLVATLVDVDLPAGEHAAVWHGRDDRGLAAPSGVYLCRLRADRTSASQRVTLVK